MKQRFKKQATAAQTLAEIRAIADAIDELSKEMAAQGLVEDSGWRKWSERTRRYEIVWKSNIYQKSDD